MTDHAELIAQLGYFRKAYEKSGLIGENGERVMANAIAALKASEARVADAEAKLEQAIKKGMLIATTIPMDELQDAFDAALAALKGGEE